LGRRELMNTVQERVEATFVVALGDRRGLN
jgi:hypothetical protein